MLARPRFQPHLHVETFPGEGLVILSETAHVILAEPVYASVATYLDGLHSPDAIVAALEGQVEATEVKRVLEHLAQQGLVTDASGEDSSREAAFWASCNVDSAAATQRLVESSVSLAAVGDVELAPFREALGLLGIRISSDAAREVVVTDDYLRGELARHNERALASERAWLLVKPYGYVIWLGPVFSPGRTACWECLAVRIRANRYTEQFVARRKRSGLVALSRLSTTNASEQIAARIVALTIATWLAGDELPALNESLVTLDLRSWRSETHRVVARPQCRACGDPPEIAFDVARPVMLESRLKKFTADGGHRTLTPEATVARFQHHVSPISGAVPTLQWNGGQERDGVLYAYVAGANFSRPPRALAMLRAGLRGRTGGKGASDAQARASALCEALERYSGVFQGHEPQRHARRAALGDAAIHPNACMGFSDHQYDERGAWNARGEMMHAVPLPFDEDAVISWTPVWSLTRGETRYLPTAFCFYDYPVFPEAAYCIACSNGNAAGNTLEEAILQGLFELVERDSVALWWYSRARRPRVAIDSFDEPYVHEVEAYLARCGRDLEILDVTADLRIPVFAAVSRRRDRLPEQIVLGFGAHLDPRIALLRAVTELNQMLAPVLWRDRLAGEAPFADGEPSVREWLATATLADHPHLVPDPGSPPRRAADFARCWSNDLREDIRFCQRSVEGAGMELLVLDQTRPDIGLPVVKVIVPGLRHFWPRFAPGRLYTVPVELGWIEQPLSEAQLNPVGMFL
jgi:ribosomal protein S12 methylthiotransferase accessory factor